MEMLVIMSTPHEAEIMRVNKEKRCIAKPDPAIRKNDPNSPKRAAGLSYKENSK